MNQQIDSIKLVIRLPTYLHGRLTKEAARKEISLNSLMLAKLEGRSSATAGELEGATPADTPWNAAFGGKRVREIAILMLAAFVASGSRRAGDRFKGDAWVLDRDAYRGAVFGVIRALMDHSDLTPEEVVAEIEGIKSFMLSRAANSPATVARQKAG